MFRYLGFAILVGESPTLTIVRSGQVVISGIGGGNNFYESPEVNGQSAEQKAQVGTIPWSNKMESLSIKQRLPSRNYPPAGNRLQEDDWCQPLYSLGETVTLYGETDISSKATKRDTGQGEP